MKFKVVGKKLILTDYLHEITEGENSFDAVEITVPRYHDDCDLSTLSFRFSETSEDGESSAVQVLRHTKCDEKYIHLKGTITSNLSAITGKVIFMLTGVSVENIVAKFQSTPYTISDDISLTSLPNETTAEQLFNQAQLEVQKAMDAAERAEKASQTPAPAEIYPATKERLGGVLSSKDISVDSNGIVTVNSVNGKSLENEITDVKSFQKSISSLAVQNAHPSNYLIYDDLGKPSVMVAIPKFYLDEVINGASHTVHPAFIINGIEHDVIYISKYQNVVENGRAYSLPMKEPQVNVTFNQAYDYCKTKGEGWHLMTNAEWAAIALWCKKNGTMPKGNNNYGKDISESNLPQYAIAASRSNGKILKILTGSGPESWYHNGNFNGIADLNGNIYEWNSGLRINDGEIQVIVNNDAADYNNSVSSESTHWKAIMPDGILVTPGTEGTFMWDYTVNTPVEIDGNFQLNTELLHKQQNNIAYGAKKFQDLQKNKDVNIPEILKALAIFPADTSGYEDDYFFFKNIGERLSLRGGHEHHVAFAGIFHLNLLETADYSTRSCGFRCAYYGNI